MPLTHPPLPLRLIFLLVILFKKFIMHAIMVQLILKELPILKPFPSTYLLNTPFRTSNLTLV